MKKTTISLAVLAISTASVAFIGQPGNWTTKTYCINVEEDASGNKYAGTCDRSDNNQQLNLVLGTNGCAEGQASLTTRKGRGQQDFPIQIHPCMPPNAAQL